MCSKKFKGIVQHSVFDIFVFSNIKQTFQKKVYCELNQDYL